MGKNVNDVIQLLTNVKNPDQIIESTSEMEGNASASNQWLHVKA